MLSRLRTHGYSRELRNLDLDELDLPEEQIV